MPDSESTLVRALSELAALGTDRDHEQLAALQDRLDAARLRVLVAGEAKRGKSTLVNALLGREGAAPALRRRRSPGPAAKRTWKGLRTLRPLRSGTGWVRWCRCARPGWSR